MTSPGPEGIGAKRKRSPIDDAVTRPPPNVHAGIPPAPVTRINYLMKAKIEKLRLIEGDVNTFGDVLSMIDDYEGVLQRHESLAANLGAKLVGPLLLKSFEKLFDGPIKVIQPSFALEQAPITWLEIVIFARTNLSDFVLGDSDQGKAYRVWIKGGQIEISEDDYRLIMSGAPERMIPTQPIPEDDSSELGTLNILETRIAMLIKKADAVASKARQLNYHLKGRKTAVLARKAELSNTMPENDPFIPAFSPQPFSAMNTHTRSPAPSNSDISKLQSDLLEQFLSHSASRRGSNTHLPGARGAGLGKANRPIDTYSDERGMSHPQNSEDGTENQVRVLMAAKIEKLARGDPITPMCDRCKRLKFACTKHLTACSACTKKHAKCSWKDVGIGELDALPQSPPVPVSSAGNGVFEGGNGHMDAFGMRVVGRLQHVEGVERNLDPGFRVDEMRASPDGPGRDTQMEHRLGLGMQAVMDLGNERKEAKENEQQILTHIASAAAGGSR